jgi:uncharacterized membrane protein
MEPAQKEIKNANNVTEQNVEKIAEMDRQSYRARRKGERVADAFAKLIGSWAFIIIQSILLCVWIVLNVFAWINHWDPYPFILMNLALSFQAAYAGPIIMMSQNRHARLSERRNNLDLQINLLAEQENTEMLRLLRKLCLKLEIPIDEGEDSNMRALEEQTSPEEIIAEIEKALGKQKAKSRINFKLGKRRADAIR